jgi:hypothetical protein
MFRMIVDTLPPESRWDRDTMSRPHISQRDQYQDRSADCDRGTNQRGEVEPLHEGVARQLCYL